MPFRDGTQISDVMMVEGRGGLWNSNLIYHFTLSSNGTEWPCKTSRSTNTPRVLTKLTRRTQGIGALSSQEISNVMLFPPPRLRPARETNHFRDFLVSAVPLLPAGRKGLGDRHILRWFEPGTRKVITIPGRVNGGGRSFSLIIFLAILRLDWWDGSCRVRKLLWREDEMHEPRLCRWHAVGIPSRGEFGSCGQIWWQTSVHVPCVLFCLYILFYPSRLILVWVILSKLGSWSGLGPYEWTILHRLGSRGETSVIRHPSLIGISSEPLEFSSTLALVDDCTQYAYVNKSCRRMARELFDWCWDSKVRHRMQKASTRWFLIHETRSCYPLPERLLW